MSGIEFEWDPAKAAANFAKHAVTFEEALTVFMDLNRPGMARVAGVVWALLGAYLTIRACG